MKEILEEIAKNPQQDYTLLARIVAEIRPTRSKNVKFAISQIENLIALLYTYPELKMGLYQYWLQLTQKRSSLRLLTDLGIYSNQGFFTETNKKIAHKLLPEIQSENTFVFLLEKVFHKKTDHLWVSKVPSDVWMRLLAMTGIRSVREMSKDHLAIEQILNALVIISLRITNIGLDPEMVDRLPELEKFGSPFLAQNEEIDQYVADFKENPTFDRSQENHDYKQIQVILSQCDEYVNIIRKSREKYGISLNITYMLIRLTQNIQRLRLLLSLLVKNEAKAEYHSEVIFLKQVVKFSNQKNSLLEHIGNNVSLLAFQITEHAGKTGEHYITSTRKDYWKMFRSASWGGFIVALLCVFKTLFYYLKLAPFGQAFVYSMNYSLGFITIFVTKSALATKQPAMTATRIAQSLDTQPSKDSDYNEKFASLIAKVARSQLIAFAGNVVVAFPVAIVVGWFFYGVMGEHIADPEKAHHMIEELHPTRSYALFHAGIAGVYLFMAGLISGYYDNKSISNKIPQRIKAHPLLKRILPERWLNQFSNYIEHNLGGLAGNFYFGIFLGSTGTLGMILGLPIDIRHITFAAGNFGLAIVVLEHQVSIWDHFVSFLGILGIGFMNFIVSFSLAITVAVQSRRVNLKGRKKLLVGLWKFFIKNPSIFAYPPKDGGLSTTITDIETKPKETKPNLPKISTKPED